MSSLQEGFGEKSGQKFWTIKNGFITQRCAEDTEGAVAVKKKDGSTIHEIHKTSITGKLRKVEVRHHDEYGDFLGIHLMVKDQPIKVECDFNSGYAFGFLSTVPNADLGGLMMISPSYSEKDGKKESKIFIQQDAGWLKHFFTKENPNGLPELKKVKVNGKETWDSTDRGEYFKTMITKLNAQLDKIWGEAAKTETATVAEKSSDLPVETGIKVPF